MSSTTHSSSPEPAGPATSHPVSSPPRPPPPPRTDDADQQLAPFRLLDLPAELVVHVAHLVDERDPSPTFPSGPSSELLALSATSRFFHAVCQPLKWRSVKFVPDTVLRPRAYRKKRDMRALEAILRTRAHQQQPLPIVALCVSDLSADNDELWDLDDEDELPKEEAALARVVERLAATSLQVLFLSGLELHRDLGDSILRAIATSPKMSAVRFNQVDFYPDEPRCVRDFAQLDHIKTLQIMHSDSEISELVAKCPNVDSLLLWPSLRRVGRHMPAVKSFLPHLRNLSLDSVHEARVFRVIADEIIRLSDSGIDLPLEELFLEGPCVPEDLAVLVQAVGRLPSLRRLALYQAQEPRPALVADLAQAAPQLEALTLVAGDCQEAVSWPAPLDAYLTQLAKFTKLRFFAWDRLSPRGPLEQDRRAVRQLQVEYATLSRLGGVCKSLREAVCITSDVSEGSSGFFATYTREKGARVRIAVKQKTVNDFLIAYDRWIKVEED
ncbi:hypothetical protein JCM3775_003009 [Rhodotorula graminis]|uniref:F-box domain-containing protein n=1 Tax=Rhodotorula graminis (strain WP1) TaxID=578459 RepID=A0A194SB48_RHOGW|nr:uncharacterized protein RHOBADRAFT_52606 [Rhodotorula graminis WP1]KPV76626.1 hypothetical protein RHOBADRAFT_52606 [Rhodotorula graminis WP1]